MEEIDRRRAVLEPLRAEKKTIRARLEVCSCGDCRDVAGDDLISLRMHKEEPAEVHVLEALREWWAQLERAPRCLARLTWIAHDGEEADGSDAGHRSKCPRCGNELFGLLEDPAAHPFCLAELS